MFPQFEHIAPIRATPISLKTGRFTTKHYTTLKYNGFANTGHYSEHQTEIQTQTKPLNFDKHDNGVGDMRDVVKSLAQFTIWGKQGTVAMDVRHHSFAGMNKEMLTSTGELSFLALSKAFKEFNSDLDIKEARVNYYIEKFAESGFYDNMTPLFVSLYQKRYRLDIADKLEVIDKIFTLGPDVVRKMKGQNKSIVFKELYNHVVGNKLANMSNNLLDNDQAVSRLMGALKRLESVEKTDTNTKEKTKSTGQQEIDVVLPCWEMYDYNDGHNVSGKSFGDVVGFINNLYVVPEGVNRFVMAADVALKSTRSRFPKEDTMIDNLAKKDGFLDCAGMTQREISILEWAIAGNTRITPMLVDQTFSMVQAGSRVIMYNTSHEVAEIENISVAEIDRTIRKLVINHNTYQEHYNALVLLKDWVAQPATETLESHWWLTLDRTLSLPVLGLKRAAFPQLMRGEPVCITSLAIENFADVFDKKETLYVVSGVLNTAYQWAEYLLRYNAVDTSQLLRLKRYAGQDDLTVKDRTIMLQSAILGVAIPVSNYFGASTYLSVDIEEQYKNVVRFGKIDVEHLSDYGYTQQGSSLTMNTVVTPGATMVIVGLNSSLLKNTPLESNFVIPPTYEYTFDGRVRRSAYFKDVWAMGVLARWNGYDMKYLTPGTYNTHSMFAANNVSIAMPPVMPINLRATERYVVLGTYERKNSWGDDFEWSRGMHTHFNWNRIYNELLDGNDYHARPIYKQSIGGITPRRLRYVQLEDVEVITAMVSTFSVSERHFLGERIIAGVTLPPAEKLSSRLEVEDETENATTENAGLT
uniref:Coat protein n=1 Tax=Erysiphales associated totivirus 19 TaxID=2719848 RepID=A0A6G9ELX1_9VIRU|nr:coat protein [Erysiphales associated totivirus 19]